jgi:hypothetical protein
MHLKFEVIKTFVLVFEIENTTNEIEHGNGRRFNFITLRQVECQVFQKLTHCDNDALLLLLKFGRHIQIGRQENLQDLRDCDLRLVFDHGQRHDQELAKHFEDLFSHS